MNPENVRILEGHECSDHKDLTDGLYCQSENACRESIGLRCSRLYSNFKSKTVVPNVKHFLQGEMEIGSAKRTV